MIGKKIVLLSAVIFSAFGFTATASAGDLHESYGKGLQFENTYGDGASKATELGRR